MPKTAALAVAASRGFGEFTSGLTLTTVTFTSSTTWTTPAYLSNLVTMSGHGLNATSDDYSPDLDAVYIYRPFREGFSSGTVATHDWSDIYNNLQAWITFFNTGTAGTRSPYPTDSFFSNAYSINSDNTYNYYTSPRTPTWGSGNKYVQIGTARDSSDFSVPTSGTITYANTPAGSKYIRVGYNPVYLGSDGAASTGFGKTFPGGTYNFSTGIGGPYPTTNFSNVTVTPSTSYSVVVPSGGSISISYYAPA